MLSIKIIFCIISYLLSHNLATQCQFLFSSFSQIQWVTKAKEICVYNTFRYVCGLSSPLSIFTAVLLILTFNFST